MSRAIPSSLTMARWDRPFSLACWIAFHRATWVGVGVRSHGFDALLTGLLGNGLDRGLVDTHWFEGG